MASRILTYGLGAGLIVGGALATITIAYQGSPPPGGVGMLIGYTTMLVALSLIFVAIKRERDKDRGGRITFWRGLGLGLGITLIASLFYIAAWELALVVTGMDYGAQYAQAAVEQAKARGASEAEIAKIAADMAKFAAEYRNPLYRAPMTFLEIFPVGVLVSLVSAGLLRNPKFFPAAARA